MVGVDPAAVCWVLLNYRTLGTSNQSGGCTNTGDFRSMQVSVDIGNDLVNGSYRISQSVRFGMFWLCTVPLRGWLGSEIGSQTLTWNALHVGDWIR